MSTTAHRTTVGFRVNDEPRTLPTGAVLAELAKDMGIAERKGIAIAVNDTVVPRANWSTHAIADGDRVLVIRATQGG